MGDQVSKVAEAGGEALKKGMVLGKAVMGGDIDKAGAAFTDLAKTGFNTGKMAVEAATGRRMGQLRADDGDNR